MIEGGDREFLWKQYATHLELYRSYLEIALKANVFHYAVTGGVVSFYFANAHDPEMLLSLVVPIVMSTAFGGLFLWGANRIEPLRSDVRRIGEALNLGAIAEMKTLTYLLRIFGGVSLLVAALLLAFIGWKTWPWRS